MLNRVFKTIFILSLCLGITLPSNAGGVQVSEGSAFITKSEMSYKLNSLSKRMTELENSMDSRIDKLVSSYLTRNGVWNGVKQTLTTAGASLHTFLPDWQTGNVGTNFTVVTHFNECIVSNVSKTGLVFGTFGYGNKHTGIPNNWYYGGNMSNQPGWVWDQNVSIQLTFMQKEQGSTASTAGEIKTVVKIADSLGFRNWASDGLCILAVTLPNWNVVPFTFFADKGKQIWWKWTDDVSYYAAQNVRSVTFEGSKMKVQLNDVNIY